jgi:ribose transport system permease protein
MEVKKALDVTKKPFDVTKLLAPAVLVLLYAFFAVFGKNFFSTDYLVNILDGSYYIGYIAIGVTFVIITGGIDLSLGTSMMCAALLGGYAFNNLHLPMFWCLIFVIFVATAMGFLNGIMVAYLKLPPFIATLGMQFIGMGFGAIVTNVQTMRYPTFGSPGAEFKTLFYKTADGFPLGVLWLAFFFILALIILNKTRFGRYTYAIGSNVEAARLSGIKTRPWLVAVYTFCGIFTGLAGIMYSAVYTSIIPSTGSGQELLGIAGAVIGGTSLMGGTGTLTGTIIGVFIMSVLKQGLMSMGLQAHWQTFFTGVVVIGAVLLDQYRVARGNRVKKA